MRVVHSIALLCASLMFSVAAAVAQPPRDVDPWLSRHLSEAEIRGVWNLANRIAVGETKPEDAPEVLRTDVGNLSIRQAAALGTLLLDKHQIDPRPWLAMPHAREQDAADQLKQLLQRFDRQEPGYRNLETTVRGPKRLQQHCGEEVLTEVVGVGFRAFYDGGIPAPTEFGDDLVDAVFALAGLRWVAAPWSKLTDTGVVRLAALPRLRELEIPGANITDNSLRALGENRQFRSLDISNAEHEYKTSA